MSNTTRKYRGDVRTARDKYADIITESFEIKKLVREKLDGFGISLWKFCNENGLPYDRIKFWLNTTKTKTVRGVVSQNDIKKVCENLGIGIRLTLVVDSSFQVPDEVKYSKRKKVKKAYGNSVYKKVKEHERKSRENKGAPPEAQKAD